MSQNLIYIDLTTANDKQVKMRHKKASTLQYIRVFNNMPFLEEETVLS